MRNVLVSLLLLGVPAAASAQFDIPLQRTLIGEAVDIIQPRFGIALSGGNPLPGAASTLGMRLGKVPRVSVALRGTATNAEMPSIRRRSDSGEVDFLLKSVNVDAAVGVFSGFGLLPTVGGFGSIDVIASAGALFIPDEGGFREDTKKSWAIGTRVGILRESFTLPGLAVTGMYRRIGDIQFGDLDLTQTDAAFTMDDLSALSVRGTVGKKLFGIGAVAGIGFDRYSSDTELRHMALEPDDETLVPVTWKRRSFENDRLTFFGNVSYTLLVLSLNGELGWQNGGDKFGGALPPGRSIDPEKSAWYGSLAFRLSI